MRVMKNLVNNFAKYLKVWYTFLCFLKRVYEAIEIQYFLREQGGNDAQQKTQKQ